MKRIWTVLAVVFLPLISCDNLFQTLANKPDSQYLVVIGGEGGCVVNFVSPECDIEANPKTLIVWSPAKSTGSLPEKPQREGYTFTGWNTKEDGKGTEFTSNTDVPTDISVYAQWKINTYTVTFDPGGAAGDVPGALSADAFSVINLPDKGALEKTGHEFGGWNVSSSGTGINYGVNSPYTVTDNVTLYAKWNPAGTNINTVVFESNGGSRIPDQAVNSGSTAIVPAPPPVKRGYKFSGWFADQGLIGEYDFSTPVSEDITLYAKWAIEQYTVTFDSNGAAGDVPGALSAEAFSVITLPGKGGLAKAGYEFGGWNDNTYGTGINYSAGAEYIPDDNITLYAKWNTPGTKTYTVAFDSKGGSAVASQTVISGERAFRPAVPYLANHDFSGWFADQGLIAEYDFSSPVTGNITLYAKWTKERYTVSFNVNGAAGTVPEAVSAEAGESITLPGQGGLAKTGYSFAGWNTNRLGSGTNYSGDGLYTVNGNTVLYANWKAHVYKIVYNKNADDAAGTMEDSEHVYGIYKPLNPNAFTRVDYVIAEWNTSADGSGTSYQNNESVRNLSENDGDEVVLYAQWKSIVYHNVSFNTNGGSGAVPESKTVIDGEGVILPDGDGLSKAGYVFYGWNANAAGSGTNYPAGSYYIPSGNITLYARWAIAYTVTFNSSGGSSVSAQTVISGETARRPYDPTKSGFTFDGWYGDSTFGAAYDFSSPVTQNITLYAKWSAATYTVTFNAEGGTPAPPAQILNYGGTVTRPQAMTREGYTFNNWYGDSTFGAAYNFSSPVTEDITIYAGWTPITYTVAYNANGGSGNMTNSSHTYGVYQSLSSNQFTLTGYTFAGWNTAQNGTGTSYGNYQSVRNLSSVSGAVVTLYAQWTRISYTVTFYTNGGTPVPENQTINEGEKVSRPTDPEREGYTFVFWYNKSEDLQYDFNAQVTGNLSLYALWKE